MARGLILPQCDVWKTKFWGIDNNTYIKTGLIWVFGSSYHFLSLPVCPLMHLYALLPVSLTHTYKEKICSRCLMIIWVAWGSQCGAVLVGLPLEGSWRVCGAQIRLIDAHLLWSINRYESATYLQSSVCGCVYCILLALLYVLRKTHTHTQNTHTHTQTLAKVEWLSNENDEAEVGSLITGSFHFTSNFFSSHLITTVFLHYSHIITFCMTVFPWLLYYVSLQSAFNLDLKGANTYILRKCLAALCAN